MSNPSKAKAASFSCPESLVNDYKDFCITHRIRYSHPIAVFLEHFIESQGNVNFKKDFVAERWKNAKAS